MSKLMRHLGAVFFILCGFSSCAQEPEVTSEGSEQTYKYELVTDGIDIPWGMAWLNPDTFLVTDKKGELRLIQNGKLLEKKIAGVPKVFVASQPGLLDVEVDPNYKDNQFVYLSYAGFEGKEEGSHTSVIRARIENFELVDKKVIFDGGPNSGYKHHYGGRMEFDKDGYLYLSIGDRGQRDVNPQRLDTDAGKIHRINSDGSIPADNPFVGHRHANPSIYSYGHRNPQGMEIHPTTGKIWTHEHGPKGGDEINMIKKGANYGWPVISYGVNYSGTSFTDLTEKEGMEQPQWHWTPSIAPSGMTFVTSGLYPDWQGKMIVGSLKFAHLALMELDGDKVVGQEKLFSGIGRVRSVKQGADGYIYVGVDGKGIFKIIPID